MKMILAVWLLLLTLAVGCATPSSPVSPTPAPPPPTETIRPSSPTPASSLATASATPAPKPVPKPAPVTSSPVPSPKPAPSPSPPSSPSIDVQSFIEDLEAPWAIGFAPDGRIFVTERPGRVRVIKNGRLDPQPWITLPVVARGESGLLGLAIDPAFAQNGFIYVAYTYEGGERMQNRLVRLIEDPRTGRGAEDRVLLEGIAGNTTHDGGRVKFGPDGKLYWTMGDAQAQPASQERSVLNGKILRLNSDGTIPPDNPFPGSPVWSYGHRNPQGLAWQPGTGRLYETEHGSSAHDEVNYIEPGKNYGWPVITGEQTREGMLAPVIQSGNDTWAPTGAAFVTRGGWLGSMVFTGLRGESLYRLNLDTADPRKVLSFETLFKGKYGRLRDVVEGPDGALYMLTNNRDGRGRPVLGDDRILRIVVR